MTGMIFVQLQYSNSDVVMVMFSVCAQNHAIRVITVSRMTTWLISIFRKIILSDYVVHFVVYYDIFQVDRGER